MHIQTISGLKGSEQKLSFSKNFTSHRVDTSHSNGLYEYSYVQFNALDEVFLEKKFFGSSFITEESLILTDCNYFPSKAIVSSGAYVLEAFTQNNLNRPLTYDEECNGVSSDVLLPHCNPALHIEKFKNFIVETAYTDYAVVGSRFMNNYGHWHMEVLASISFLEEASIKCKYVFPQLASWQKKSLSMAGIDNERLLEVTLDSIVNLPKVYYPSPSWLYKADIYKIPPTLHSTIHKIKSKLPNYLNQSIFERIYITRLDSSNRPLTNKKNLEELFCLEYNFSVITPEHLSYEEQLMIFSNAKIIAGPSGAAFTSLAFCKKLEKFIEIGYPNGWFEGWHQWARYFQEINHFVYVESEKNIIFKTPGLDEVPIIKSWEVNIESLRKFLNNIL